MPEAVSAHASFTAGTVPHSDDDSSPDQTPLPPPCQRSTVLLLPEQTPLPLSLSLPSLRWGHGPHLEAQTTGGGFDKSGAASPSKLLAVSPSWLVFLSPIFGSRRGRHWFPPLSIARTHRGESVTLANVSASHELSKTCKD